MSAVDVVVPCYNYAHYLTTCVKSVLDQREVETRVLIVDDCSPDHTQKVAEVLVAADTRVTYVRNDQNLGLVGSANRGVLDWARAPYTLLLSADDALTAGALARSTSVMDRHPEIGMTYGLAMVINEEDRELYLDDSASFEYACIPGDRFIEGFCARGNQVASPTALVRTKLQQTIGGYHPNFPHTCDVEMWLRFATKGPVAVIKYPQAFYRWHGVNMSSGYIDRPLSDIAEQLATVKEVRRAWGGEVKGFDRWIAEMERRLATEAWWLASLAFEADDRAAMNACVDFAQQIYHHPSVLPAYWKLQARKLIGPHAIRQIKRLSGRTFSSARPVPFSHGSLFGGWPDGI